MECACIFICLAAGHKYTNQCVIYDQNPDLLKSQRMGLVRQKVGFPY
jgi:hypothetical protein